MRYEELPPITRVDFEAALHDGSRDQQATAILRLALHDDDPTFVEYSCKELLNADDVGVRRAAVIAVGHLARLHGRVSPDLQSRVRSLEADPAMTGTVADALDDIASFVRP